MTEMTLLDSIKIRCFDAENQITVLESNINGLNQQLTQRDNLLVEIAGKLGILYTEGGKNLFDSNDLIHKLDETLVLAKNFKAVDDVRDVREMVTIDAEPEVIAVREDDQECVEERS